MSSWHATASATRLPIVPYPLIATLMVMGLPNLGARAPQMNLASVNWSSYRQTVDEREHSRTVDAKYRRGRRKFDEYQFKVTCSA